MKTTCSLLVCLFVFSPIVAGDSPIERFGELAVGSWEGEDSRHVLEWGVGRRVIHSRSYFESEGSWELVSEGMWFWDSHEKTIRGVAVAIRMPVELFEYRSEIRGDEIVHDLLTRGESGGRYLERWRFSGEEYRWSLEDPQQGTEIMGGVYRRGGPARKAD